MLPVIVITGQQNTAPRPVECMKLGALDYFIKPLVLDDVLVSVQRAARLARIRAARTTILMVGGDRGEAATLRVPLPDGAVALSAVPTVQDALDVVAADSPVIAGSVRAARRDRASERSPSIVGRQGPTAVLLVVDAGSHSMPPWPEDRLRVSGVLRAPYRLHELVGRMLHAVRAAPSRLTVAVVQAAEYVSRNYHEPCSPSTPPSSPRCHRATWLTSFTIASA